MCLNVGKNNSDGICISYVWLNNIQTQNYTQGFSTPIKHVGPSPSQHLSYYSGTLAYLSAWLWGSQRHILFVFSVWLNTSYMVSSQQILAKPMEVVSTCSIGDIVLAGGKIKIWSTFRVSWQNTQYIVGQIREALQRTKILSVSFYIRNQLSP